MLEKESQDWKKNFEVVEFPDLKHREWIFFRQRKRIFPSPGFILFHKL